MVPSVRLINNNNDDVMSKFEFASDLSDLAHDLASGTEIGIGWWPSRSVAANWSRSSRQRLGEWLRWVADCSFGEITLAALRAEGNWRSHASDHRQLNRCRSRQRRRRRRLVSGRSDDSERSTQQVGDCVTAAAPVAVGGLHKVTEPDTCCWPSLLLFGKSTSGSDQFGLICAASARMMRAAAKTGAKWLASARSQQVAGSSSAQAASGRRADNYRPRRERWPSGRPAKWRALALPAGHLLAGQVRRAIRGLGGGSLSLGAAIEIAPRDSHLVRAKNLFVFAQTKAAAPANSINKWPAGAWASELRPHKS